MATMSSPYSTGTTYFSNGYQPNTINGSKLKKTGKTVGQTGLKGSTSYGGKNMDSQNIWKDGNGNQWIWIRTGDSMGYYIQYNPSYKGKVDFAGGNSASYDKYMVSSKTGTKTTNPTYWKSSADAEYQKTTSSTYKAPEPKPTPNPTPNPIPTPITKKYMYEYKLVIEDKTTCTDWTKWGKDKITPDQLQSFMTKNKTEWSMRVFQSGSNISYPAHIRRAIGCVDDE